MKKLDKNSLIIFVISILACLIAYLLLPETIPLHFDNDGNVTGSGNRAFIFILSIVPPLVYRSVIKKFYPWKA